MICVLAILRIYILISLRNDIRYKCKSCLFNFLGSSDSLPGTWQSTTTAVKPLSHDRLYYFLPYWDEKPTVYIRSSFPDHRRRMYNSNAIQKVSDKVVSMI